MREEQRPKAYGEYVAVRMNEPAYRPTYVRLARMLRIVREIDSCWRTTDREQALRELGEALKGLHELELDAEKIDDPLIREHVFDRLEVISARRRSVAEEIRWEIMAAKIS